MTDIAIRVTVSTVDRFRKTRSFKTLKGAQRFAAHHVGKTPEISEAFGYAVSGSGTAKVEARGCLVADLFPDLKPAQAVASTEPDDPSRVY